MDNMTPSDTTKSATSSPRDDVCESADDRHTAVRHTFDLLEDSEPSIQEGDSLASVSCIRCVPFKCDFAPF
jgi:hypothetical protein